MVMVKKKLLALLTAKCGGETKLKDMGLSEKVIEEIAGIASNGLADDVADEDLETRANLFFPMLKTTQGEATRWAQAKPTPPVPPVPPVPPNPLEGGDWKTAMEELKKSLTEQMETTYGKTITELQTQLQVKERDALIATERTKLGLTDADMEFVTVPSDADVPEFLGKVKQSLVNRGLKPADPNVSKDTKDKANTEFADALVSQYAVEQK